MLVDIFMFHMLVHTALKTTSVLIYRGSAVNCEIFQNYIMIFMSFYVISRTIETGNFGYHIKICPIGYFLFMLFINVSCILCEDNC